MTSSSDQPQPSPITNVPPGTTGIQTSSGTPAPAEPASVPLPPAPKPPPQLDAAKFLRQRNGLDAVLVAMVLLFAFLVASFPAANPDFFAQAATGRLILEGKYQFGVDPFVYSADEGDYFVNHSWLFAVLMYGLYQIPSFGGAVVVIFKALVIALLAEILLRASRRPGQSLWIPASCIALAILVLSPRLYLQSTSLSYLFLGLTIWLLMAERPGGKRYWWLLPPLFALWVNCDSWFFLGPLTLALYLAGEWLQYALPASETTDKPGTAATDSRSANAAQPAPPSAVGWLVLLVGLAACLLNPHHIHAFTLPTEFGLTSASDLIENDPQFRALFLSPKDYYQTPLGLNTAGLAYWPLLLLSLASFAFVSGRLPWGRLAVCVGFALMSLYNVRAIPFFAIVSGPLMAWNWQDYARQLFGSTPPLTVAWRNWMLGGRVFSVFIGLVLLVATVPGRLQNQPQSRRLGWSVSINPSLMAMADTIRDWRESGKLGADEPHWFNMHAQVANYLAYFAPGERVYLDQALPHFRKAAEDYEDIRQGLAQMSGPQAGMEGAAAEKKDWQKILRERHVRYWILDTQTIGGLPEINAPTILFAAYKDWVLCYLQGSIAIFAWHDPQQPEAPDRSAGLTLDLKRAAFGPDAEPAPPRGPDPIPMRDWWDTTLELLWPPNPPRSIDADSIALYEFRYMRVEHGLQVQKHSRAWRNGIAAATIAGSLSQGPVPNNLLSLNWAWTYNDMFPAGGGEPMRQLRPSEQVAMRALVSYVNGQFFEPPSLYMALRACRRALLANPEDGASYFRLGQTYQRLRNLPQERNFRTAAQLLGAIRSTQMAGAFQNALRFPLDDDKAAQAHEALVDLYGRQLRYIDAAAHHLREAVNKRAAAGPPAGMSATEHKQRLDQMSDQLNRLEDDLEKRLDRYNLNAASKSGVEKVRFALQEGLSETALETLKQAVVDSSNPNEVALVKQAIPVALDLGQLDEARLLLPDPKDEPINPEDLNLYVRLAAARGDYAQADQFLADALRRAWKPAENQQLLYDANAQIALLVGKALLSEGQRLTSVPCMPLWPNNPGDIVQRPMLTQNASEFWMRRWRLEAIVNGMLMGQQNAELCLLRGWLALESGHCVEARKHLQATRGLTISSDNWIPEVNKLNAWLFPQDEINRIRQLGLRHSILDALSAQYLSWLEEEK